MFTYWKYYDIMWRLRTILVGMSYSPRFCIDSIYIIGVHSLHCSPLSYLCLAPLVYRMYQSKVHSHLSYLLTQFYWHKHSIVSCSEIKVKKNVTFDSADSTATYREPRTLVFNRSMSVGTENDTFTTINVPLVVGFSISNLVTESCLWLANSHNLLPWWTVNNDIVTVSSHNLLPWWTVNNDVIICCDIYSWYQSAGVI